LLTFEKKVIESNDGIRILIVNSQLVVCAHA